MAQVFPLTADESGLDEPQAALVQTLAELPEEWTLLRQRRIGDAGADAVLVHPAVGVALIDLAPNTAEEARAALIAHLERERFFQYFPGELPVVAVSIAVEDLSAIGERLEASFAAAPALGIGDGDWADAVIELLLQPEDVAMTPTNSFAAPPPDLEPAPEPPVRQRPGASEPLPFTLRAEFPIAYEEVRPRRPGRAAAIAVALLAIIGAGVAAWSLGGDQGGPSPDALRQAQVEIPLTPPQATSAPASSAPAAKPVPPPLPAAPAVTLAAKPFASPPPAAPKPTAVAALPTKPPVVMAAKTPAPLPPAAPRPTRVAPLPTMAAQAAPPAGSHRAAAKPRPRREEVVGSRKPQREARQQSDESQQLMQRQLNTGSSGSEQALAPPVDIGDLPRLPPEASQPSPAPAPAPAPAIAAPSGSTIGPPVRLVRQPEVPTAASGGGVPVAVSATASSQRECRPYTSSTTLTGRAVAVQGIACRDGDGQWRLVSEAPQR